MTCQRSFRSCQLSTNPSESPGSSWRVRQEHTSLFPTQMIPIISPLAKRRKRMREKVNATNRTTKRIPTQITAKMKRRAGQKAECRNTDLSTAGSIRCGSVSRMRRVNMNATMQGIAEPEKKLATHCHNLNIGSNRTSTRAR